MKMAGRWSYRNGLVVIPVSLRVFFYFGAFNPLSVFFIFFPSLSGADAPDSHRVDEHFADQFFLKQVDGSDCLALDVEEVDFATCEHQNPEQKGLCYSGNRAVIKPCDDNSLAQKWHYDFQKKTIHYQGYSASMCLSRVIEGLEMLPCTESSSAAIKICTRDKSSVSQSRSRVMIRSLNLFKRKSNLF